MTFNYENRRELAAKREYQAAMKQKRDIMARRMKGDDKKINLDINKIYTEIRNGNLAVLEDLDKAGISYTLNNNGQAFDGKSDDYSVTFEVDGATYTAYHEGLTKEQEEAKAKESAGKNIHSLKEYKELPFISISKAIDIMEGKAVNRATAEEPKKKAVQEPTPAKDNGTTTVTEVNVNNLLNNAVYATTEPANTTVTATSETTQGTVSISSTGNSTTVAVDKNKAEVLLEELKNAILSADAKVYVDHGVTNVEHDKALAFVNTFAPKMTEIFMTKYGYTKEFAQILTDAIIEKSFWDNYDRVGAKRLNPLATKDYAMDPDCETTVKTYDTAKILQSVLGYMSDTDSVVYHGDTQEETSQNRGISYTKSFSELLTFYKGMYHWNHDRCTHCKDVVENIDLEYSTNDFKILDVILEKYFTKLYPDLSNNGNTSCADMENVINKTLEQVKSKLEQLLNFHGSWIHNDQGQFPVERLDELDKDGNGYLDDLFKIIQEATEYVTDGKYTEVKEALETLIKQPDGNNTYSCDTALAYFDKLITALDNNGINYIETEYYNNTDDNSRNRYLKFNFYGFDYEITLNNDITRGEYPYYCTIQSKPSENNSNNNSLESQLMEILDMTAEHPEYNFSPYSSIQKLLNEMNIKYEVKEHFYNVNNWSYTNSILNFTFNGKDYQIVNYSDVTPVEDNRTINDITDDDLNSISINDSTSILDYLGESEDFNYDCLNLLNEGDAYASYFFYPDEPYQIIDASYDEARRNMVRALGQLLRDKYGINNLRASKEDNKQAFMSYLQSINAYNKENGKIDIKKIVKALCDDVPKFKDYVKALYIEWTKPRPKEEPHIIIRTRDAKETTNTEYSEEVQKYIDEAKSHFGISDNYTNSYLHTYLYNLYWRLNEPDQWSLDSIKKSMITICDIVSSFPELKSIVTEFFGNDYRTKINSYTDADSELLHCLSSNHPELVNPLMYMLDKMDEKMKEYIEQLKNPNNQNGYTDVYYK